MSPTPVEFELNGRAVRLEVAGYESLLHALRYGAAATEVKAGCDRGDCGACAVLVDGRPVNSCLTLAVQVEGKAVTTVRGLSDRDGPNPLLQAFLEAGAAQCGFCIPGMLMTLHAFVSEKPDATRDEIREAISGNLCRCTGYQKIVDAAEAALKRARPAAPARAVKA